jgi:hypothetical protein
MPECLHQWECCHDAWQRCYRCGQERNTLEGTVTLDTPGQPEQGMWVQSLDGHLGTLLAPFIERRVRITVETLDHD